MVAHRHLVSHDVLTGTDSSQPGWGWSAPAIATLAVLALIVAWREGSVARVALWPEHHSAFLTLNAALAALPEAMWAGLTLLGDSTVLMLLLAPFLLYRPRVWAAVLASVPAGGLFALAKYWASVPRPPAVLADFNLIGAALHNNSFPSGHSITVFAAAAAVLAVLAPSPRRGGEWLQIAAGLLVALLVAVSRIAVGAHWPLDLIAGAAGGWLAGLSGVLLARHTGWWAWLLLGPGRRVAGVGLVVWGLMLWLQPHETAASVIVLGLAGLCGIGVGLRLLLAGGPVQPTQGAPG